MAHSRLRIALPQITKYFANQNNKIFTHKEIAKFVSSNRQEWNLAKNTSLKEFIIFMVQNGNLKHLNFPFPNREEVRYTWGTVSLLETLLTLKVKSYFSHHTALQLHGLTLNPIHTIYLNHEQILRPQATYLEQKNIDLAFRNRARASNNLIDLEGKRIFILNGKNTNQLGVIDQTFNFEGFESKVRVTDLERTLIDITVRPIYSGGIQTVQKAFELAKERVSIPRLLHILSKLKHLYPYHQAIGYYLEQANYKKEDIELLKAIPQEFNFYLTNQIDDPLFNEKWKLFVVK